MDTVPAAGPSTIVQKEQSMMLTSLQMCAVGLEKCCLKKWPQGKECRGYTQQTAYTRGARM